jgi:hypothetical protein
MRRLALFLIMSAAVYVALVVPSAASAAPYEACGHIDKNLGCQFLINVTGSGVVVTESPTTKEPYDGADDTLVEIANSSSTPLSSITISSEEDIFGFDEDGICEPPELPRAAGCVVLAKNSAGEPLKSAGKPCPVEAPVFKETPTPKEEAEEKEYDEVLPEYADCAHPSPAGEPAGVTFGEFGFVGFNSIGDAVTGYEGPRNWYTGIGAGNTSGVVNFSPALAPGESTYFGLEAALTGKTITVGNGAAISTTLSGGGQSGAAISVLQGTPVTDSATLGGSGAAVATGTVSYEFFTSSTCTSAATSAGSTAVSGPAVGASTAEGALAPGKYYWVAHYSGDVNNQAVSSACGSEVLTVLAPTKTSTSQTAGPAGGTSLTIPVGTAVTDKATISGALAGTSTGSVTYTLYKNSTCTIAAASSAGTVVNGVAGSSVPVAPAVGTYYWVASYSGDGANAASASTCGSEILKVAKKASLGLPSSNICLSKRKFIVHPRAPKGIKLVHVEVFIDGVLKSQGALNKGHTTVSLIGLPKGTYQVELVVTSSKGQLFEDVRTFHTCVPKKHHHG